MNLVGAYSFFGNQLSIGAGARGVFVTSDDGAKQVLTMVNAAPQVGVIVKPDDVPWRIGVTGRAGVTADGPSVSSGQLVLPNRITQPWELEAGVAYQLGPRPLNPRWINPDRQEDELEKYIERARQERAALHRAEIASMPGTTYEEVAARELRIARIAAEEEDIREEEDARLRDADKRLKEERRARYDNWPRERVLLLASVLVYGPSRDAVAVEGFINQEREIVGESLAVAPRFGVESEPISNWVKLRAGIYFEPSRFSDGTFRQHFTYGFDVKLFPWDVFGILPRAQTWRLSAFLDVAPRYENFGFAIGVWH
jgi:hypothetical protein